MNDVLRVVLCAPFTLDLLVKIPLTAANFGLSPGVRFLVEAGRLARNSAAGPPLAEAKETEDARHWLCAAKLLRPSLKEQTCVLPAT